MPPARYQLLIRLLLLVIPFVWTGCQPGDTVGMIAETDEPHFRRGKQLVKAGRNQEALAAFLRVVDKRGGDAPESHLEAGIIHQQHIKDPVSAIYHYRRYLELRPNSPQADPVRQRIDAATRDFARSLPARPLDAQIDRLELMDVVEALRKENQELKEQLNRLQEQTMAMSPPTSQDYVMPSRPGVSAPAVSRETESGAQTARRHIVVAGDTLYRISLRYYGTGGRWREIYEANRAMMRSENDLKIGMELRIP